MHARIVSGGSFACMQPIVATDAEKKGADVDPVKGS
jgi:hypothetical protein